MKNRSEPRSDARDLAASSLPAIGSRSPPKARRDPLRRCMVSPRVWRSTPGLALRIQMLSGAASSTRRSAILGPYLCRPYRDRVAPRRGQAAFVRGGAGG